MTPQPFNPPKIVVSASTKSISPTQHWCKVAAYSGTTRTLRFFFSGKLVTDFFSSKKILITSVNAETWKLQESSTGSLLHVSSYAKNTWEKNIIRPAEVAPFSTTSANLSFQNGALFITIPMSQRKPVGTNLSPQLKKAQQISAEVRKNKLSKTVPTKETNQFLTVQDEIASMKAILKGIADLEKSTSYRLRKLKILDGEIWEFHVPSPPSIRLDDTK